MKLPAAEPTAAAREKIAALAFIRPGGRSLQPLLSRFPGRGTIASRMRPYPQALAVLNTKQDALALLETLGNAEAFHLSTLLCGRHRSQVLQEIRDRLNRGLPCQVVSTQVVEAGVDLDFPIVMRVFGPLDGIIQAAGRCNREGRRSAGQVIVFQPQEGSPLPPGRYRTAAAIPRAMSRAGNLDLDDPETAAAYFRRRFQGAAGIARCALFDHPEPQAVQALLESVYKGRWSDLDDTAFYARSRSASNARAVVRDWLDITVKSAKENLALWFQRQRIAPMNAAENRYYGLTALALATVRERKDLPVATPRLLLRSASAGAPLPGSLLRQALRRCHTESWTDFTLRPPLPPKSCSPAC